MKICCKEYFVELRGVITTIMTSLPILLAVAFLSRLGGFKNSPKSLREFVPPKVTSMFLMFGHEGLMITNTVKASGES